MSNRCLLSYLLIIWCFIASAAGCAADIPAVCMHLPDTNTQVAATPRANKYIELLSFQFSEGLTANQAVYDRLSEDIAVIKQIEPRVAAINYQIPHEGTALVVRLNNAALVDFKSGSYHEWDCLNNHYNPVDIEESGNDLMIRFGGRYDLERMAILYKKLSGVVAAAPSYLVLTEGEPTIRVSREASTWHYVFSTGYTEKQRLFYFVSTQAGMPKFVDDVTGEPLVSVHSAPKWAEKYWFGEEIMRAFGKSIR